MHAMQYRIGLPTDYDMEIIRERVASKGSALDSFPGLALKAYLIREAGVDGSPINEYAPFYLWADVEGMKTFLYGQIGFGGIVDSFGRPPVAHYNAVSTIAGPSVDSTPLWATMRERSIEVGVDPGSVVASRLSQLRSVVQRSSLHTASLVVDPASWTSLEFMLWCERPQAEDVANGVEVFQVLHVSQPELSAVVAGDQGELNAGSR